MVDPRVYKEAKALVDHGHGVCVLVWDRKGRYASEDVVDGIQIVRIHNTGLMKALPNDLLRNPLWWRRAYKKGLELYRDGFKFDVVHCHDLDTLKTGVWLKKKLGVKLVYDAHEIFGYMISWDVPRFVTWLSFKFERTLLKDVDHIITVTEPVKQYFKNIIEKPVTLVMNCKDLIFQEYRPPKNKIFTLSYIGVIHKRRFFPESVDVVGGIEDVRFEIAAKTENMKLYRLVEEKSERYDNIEFLGPIPHDHVVPRTLKADAIICIIDASHPSTGVGVTTKLFDAMVAGRPIIVSEKIYSAEIVKKYNCGLISQYNKRAVADAIIKLRDNPKLCEQLGKNALEAAKEVYNWEKQQENLLRLYENLEKL
jgi:glycosyltransferase involved in cell wall biosynthesis